MGWWLVLYWGYDGYKWRFGGLKCILLYLWGFWWYVYVMWLWWFVICGWLFIVGSLWLMVYDMLLVIWWLLYGGMVVWWYGGGMVVVVVVGSYDLHYERM